MSHWQRMERDLHVQRQQILHSGSVSVLGTTTQVFDAEILERYEGETQIWLNEPLRCATLVRIEYSDTLLLGEVVCSKLAGLWAFVLNTLYSD